MRFVVIGMARSGTNLLVSLLNSHPQIRCYGEVFHAASIRTFEDGEAKIEADFGEKAQTIRDRDPIKFLELFYKYAEQSPFVGFKIFANHFEDVQNYVISSDGYKLIILERANRLASFSSAEIGMVTQVWHTTKAEEQTQKMHFDVNDFLRYQDFIDNVYRALDQKLSGNSDHLRLEYDELLDADVQLRMLRFLGADENVKLYTPLVKQNAKRPVDRFENQTDVIRVLSECGKMEWSERG